MVTIAARCLITGSLSIRFESENENGKKWAKRGRQHKKDPLLLNKEGEGEAGVEAVDFQLSSRLTKVRINEAQYHGGGDRKRVLQSAEILSRHYGNRYHVTRCVALHSEAYLQTYKGDADLTTGAMERVVKAWEDSALLGKQPAWDMYKPVGVEAIAHEIETREAGIGFGKVREGEGQGGGEEGEEERGESREDAEKYRSPKLRGKFDRNRA